MENKSEAAKKLLEDETIQEAFALIRTNLHERFEQVKPSDIDGLQLIKLQLHALNELIRHLRALAQSGSIQEKNYGDRVK